MTPTPRHRSGSRTRPRTLLAATLALVVLAAGAAVAHGEPTAAPTGESATSVSAPAATTPTSTAPTSTSTAPAVEAPTGVHGQVGEPAGGSEAAPAGGASGSVEAPTATTPEVAAQRPQPTSAPGTAIHPGHAQGAGKGSTKSTAPALRLPANPAPAPSALTPPGWVGFGSFGAPISGVPGFFIESFRVPPFLLPIYQAAGTAYDVPWQVLAAVNEVETDYGRDLSISSAGAEGWMQFLPSSWALYGVDATGAGYEDPYNPADAIFAAARYLAAAGGARHIRTAVYAYNHSWAYVEAVMLRAQLLGGTPPELLSAITGLTESRFPVHAPARFGDGFPTVADPPQPTTGTGAPIASGGSRGEASEGVGAGTGGSPSVAGTVIYSQAGAPVIAVQDGQITAVGDSPTLGRYVSLRDAYGNTYTYAQLGSVAALYPVLEPRVQSTVSPRLASSQNGGGLHTPRPLAPASAGVQPHSPLSQGAISSSFAMGAASTLETPPSPAAVAPPPVLTPPPARVTSPPRAFRAGPNEVYLHPLRPGVQVLAGTVLGHLGTAGEAQGPLVDPAGQSEPHLLFQIRPAGAGAPLIDPKPILDGWVRLEESSVFRARGENPFLATAPTVGQALLASKPQLEQLVLRDAALHLPRCERGEVRAGEVDRRVLAVLEFLAVSGLEPTVSAASCAHAARVPGAANAVGGAAGETLDISAIDGTPIAGHEGPGSGADIAVRRLLRLQGTMKPVQILSASSYPGSDNTETLPGRRGLIRVTFAGGWGSNPAGARGPNPSSARAAAVLAERSPLTPRQWLQLIAQLGEIPEPAVAGGPSAAAIPDPGAGAGGAGSSTAVAPGEGVMSSTDLGGG
jgi:hypothetical protein